MFLLSDSPVKQACLQPSFLMSLSLQKLETCVLMGEGQVSCFKVTSKSAAHRHMGKERGTDINLDLSCS